MSLTLRLVKGAALTYAEMDNNLIGLASGLNMTLPFALGGSLSYADTNVDQSSTGSVNSYLQSIIQNQNAGAIASADFVLSNNLGTASTYYINIGINSSGFTGSGSLNLPNASYVTSTTGDLSIGTTTNNSIHFVINSGTTDAGTIDTSKTWYLAGPTATPALKVVPTTSQVNYLSITGAITGNNVTIASNAAGITISPFNGTITQTAPAATSAIIALYSGASGTQTAALESQSGGGNLYLTAAGSAVAIGFRTSSNVLQVLIEDTSTATNYIRLSGSAGGAPTIKTSGGDLLLLPSSGNVAIANGATTGYLGTQGSGNIQFFTQGSQAAATLRLAAAGSAVAQNGIIIAPAAAGSNPGLYAADLGGTGNPNIILNLSSAGTSPINLNTGQNARTQVQILDTASSTRQLQLTGSNGGNPTISVTAGSLGITANIAQNLGSATALYHTVTNSINTVGTQFGVDASGHAYANNLSTTASNQFLGNASASNTTGVVNIQAYGVTQLQISPISGAARYITIAGSAAGNPTIAVSAGNLAITPATVITGSVTSVSGTATTAGGVAAYLMGSSSITLAWGSGAPTVSLAQGSIYLRTDGMPYVNVNGTTTYSPLAMTTYATNSAGTYNVSTTDFTIVQTTAGSTYTLPTASSYTGRMLHITTQFAGAIISNASNVVQAIGGTSTAILAATAGKWATLQSNGANWVIIASN